MKKLLQKSYKNIWRICFITLLLHPHSRENDTARHDDKKLLEKNFSNYLEV